MFNGSRPSITVEFCSKSRKRKTRDLFALATNAAYSF